MDDACLLCRLLDLEPECNDSLLTGCMPLGGDGSSAKAANYAIDAAAPAAVASISVESSDRLSYYKFVQSYMAPNIPVLIKGACRDWPALVTWSNPDGSVNIEALRAVAGHCQVAVTDTARHHHGCGPTVNMTLEQYCRWWEDHHKQQQQQQQLGDQQQPPGQEQQQTSRQEQQQQQQQQPLLYLKDFHYVGNFPCEQVYTTPEYFTEDWLNEYYDHKHSKQQQQHLPCQHNHSAVGSADYGLRRRTEQQQQQQQASHVHSSCSAAQTSTEAAPVLDSSHAVTSDYRFVYCGPAGSWTAVHSDVLRSYSWSANVVGRKRWLLLPPQYTHLLQDCHGQLPTDFFALDHWNFKDRTWQQQHQEEEQQHGQHGQRQQQQRKYAHEQFLVELVQEAGDVLFVPSGWHHMVINEADTLSINHNWINAHNVHWSWALLRKEYETATALLEDCRETACPEEFEQLVQNMLAANSGFSLQDFAEFLITIINRRLHTVQQLQQKQHPGTPGTTTARPVVDTEFKSAAEQLSMASGTCVHHHSESVSQQLQVLHCALDIHRAAKVLQQVRDAYVAAAAYNVSWWQKHSSRMRSAGGATLIGGLAGASGSSSVSSCVTMPSCSEADADGQQQLQLPLWVAEMDGLLQTARGVVESLKKLQV